MENKLWAGKYDRVTKMVEELPLNKTDRKKQITVYRRYYRYFNDGDFPRGLKLPYGIATHPRIVREILEKETIKFLKDMIRKYKSKS